VEELIMEITANAIQTVASNQNVLFTETPVDGSCSILHREGSGLVTLRGITNQCRARFKAFFSGNIAIPTGGTVGPISLAIAINGEAVATTTMIQTPAAVEEYANVASAVYLDVPAGCCLTVSVTNTSDEAINVQNANLIIERVA
jgi:hypothetical protein